MKSDHQDKFSNLAKYFLPGGGQMERKEKKNQDREYLCFLEWKMARHNFLFSLLNNFHLNPTKMLVGQNVGGKDFTSE